MSARESEPQPTLEEWVSLYTVAAALKSIAPWTWMWDSSCFGVKDPETGVVGYCTVMGKLGEHLALGVGVGPQGFAGLERARAMEEFDFADFLCNQTMLKVSFEDRGDLRREDLAVIRQFGFKFRGHNAWPLFRSYRPGYMPWFITGAEARFLTTAIEQAMDVAMRFKDNPDLLDPPRPGACLVRVARKGDPEPDWHDEWLEPESCADEEAVAELLAEIPATPELVAQARAVKGNRAGTWEIDIRATPMPIAEPGKRPYLPLQIIIVDHDGGFVFDTNLQPPHEYVNAFRDHYVRTMAKLRLVPERVLVSNRRTEAVLEPVTDALSTVVERVPKLPGVDEFHQSLARFLERGPDL